MKEMIGFLTAVIQLLTAALLLQKTREEKKKGTKHQRPRKR
ncbi:hypothetical protein NYE69_27155 [Paenibacillus sp. FSL R5-0527]